MKVAVVIPSNRPEVLRKFFAGWMTTKHADKVLWILVEDAPKKSKLDFDIPNLLHYCWEDVEAEPENWIFPRRSPAIRSFGTLQAYRLGADVVVFLDDDCQVDHPRFFEKHLKQIGEPAMTRWMTSWQELPVLPRGIPYNIRKFSPIVINHGLWAGIPDLDAKTQKENMELRSHRQVTPMIVPYGAYMPICGMNLAFARSILPAMYYGLQGTRADGTSWGYDRFDDIWSGVIAKKICDYFDWAVRTGDPFVLHNRMSNVDVNLKKEASGVELNEKFWQLVDDIPLDGCNNTCDAMGRIADSFVLYAEDNMKKREYFYWLGRAMKEWVAKIREGGKNDSTVLWDTEVPGSASTGEESGTDNLAKPLVDLGP